MNLADYRVRSFDAPAPQRVGGYGHENRTLTHPREAFADSLDDLDLQG